MFFATAAKGSLRPCRVIGPESSQSPLDLTTGTIPHSRSTLHSGKGRLNFAHMYDVDLRALLVAVRTAKDGEYVTVESNESNVRVAKNSTCMSNRSDGALRPLLTPFSGECQQLPDILAFASRI